MTFDRIKVFIHPDGRVVLLPRLPAWRLRGMIAPPKGRRVTLNDMSEAVESGAAESYARGAAR
jgi:hypothetical protein